MFYTTSVSQKKMFYTTSQNYLFSIEEKNTPSLQGIFYYASQKSIFFLSIS